MSIPAGYRMELQNSSSQAPILTAHDNCLRLYPYEPWAEYEAKLVAKADVDPAVQDVLRVVVSGACEAPIDKQGRILVPQYLREHAHLEKDVTLAGVGRSIEIWDTASFENLDINFREASSLAAVKVES